MSEPDGSYNDPSSDGSYVDEGGTLGAGAGWSAASNHGSLMGILSDNIDSFNSLMSPDEQLSVLAEIPDSLVGTTKGMTVEDAVAITSGLVAVASTEDGRGLIAEAVDNLGTIGIISNSDDATAITGPAFAAVDPNGLVGGIFGGIIGLDVDGLANVSLNTQNGTIMSMSIERAITHEMAHHALGIYGDPNDPGYTAQVEAEIISLTNSIMAKNFNEAARTLDHAAASTTPSSDGLNAEMPVFANLSSAQSYGANSKGFTLDSKGYVTPVVTIDPQWHDEVIYDYAPNIQQTTSGYSQFKLNHATGNIYGSSAGNDFIAYTYDVNVASNIYGYDGNDFISAGLGDDYVDGGNGKDTILGGDGNDRLHGNSGADRIEGNDGNDSIWGGNGADLVFGDAGDDLIYGGNGVDNLYGGAGRDTIYGGYHDDYIDGEAGDDKLYGGEGNDYIFSGAGSDVAYGNNGDDIIHGGKGSDKLYGGDGNDQLRGDDGSDHLYGGNHKDILKGNDGNDFLYGQNGADKLYGGLGNDVLYGQRGEDELWGGKGSDKFFVLSYEKNNADKFMDFNKHEGDIIRIHDVLEGFDGNDDILDFVKIRKESTDEYTLLIDENGNGDQWNVYAEIFSNTNLTDEAALLTNGNIIIT